MSQPHLAWLLHSPEATCRIAIALAPRLRAGDVLLLSGDVGAGKTHFARCLIQSILPAPEPVPSPTYTLVQTYPGPGGGIASEIWHADLYRLSDIGEIIELGLVDAFEQAICLVEWPDRLGDLAPRAALHVRLDYPDAPPGPSGAMPPQDHRRLALHWQDDATWRARLKGLCDA